MRWTRKVSKNGGSLTLTLPIDLAKYLEIEEGDNIILQDGNGKHGVYGSFWKGEKDEDTTTTE
jgi:antitoxin component of MazEF toxin-antitoxin module